MYRQIFRGKRLTVSAISKSRVGVFRRSSPCLNGSDRAAQAEEDLFIGITNHRQLGLVELSTRAGQLPFPRIHSVNVRRTLLASLVASSAAWSCQARQVEPRLQAESFINALNSGDVPRLLSLSADTLYFREQEWASAADGGGFVLGTAADTSVSGEAQLTAFYTQLATRARVEVPTAVPAPPPSDELLGAELKDADPKWFSLSLVVFLRGQGDVEHTALVGIDRMTGKVAGLYLN